MVSIALEGGLGNNLFQTAFLWSYAKKHGLDYCVPKEVINPHVNGRQYTFPGINYCDKPPLLPIYNEKHYHYEEIPKMDNVCFKGFWQSWKYFDEHRDELLKAFAFEWSLSEGMVSVQVRRGDYLNYPDFHPVVTKEYLESAMNMFPGAEFSFYSDDREWCMDNFCKKRKDCHFESTDNEILDLVNASCREHQICSNSSYGWWMHYLNQNKNKIGVFPKTWFGPALNHNTADLYLPNSIIL